jgi:hypothetical protein
VQAGAPIDLLSVVLFPIIHHGCHGKDVDLAYPTGEGANPYSNQSAFDVQSHLREGSSPKCP